VGPAGDAAQSGRVRSVDEVVWLRQCLRRCGGAAAMSQTQAFVATSQVLGVTVTTFTTTKRGEQPDIAAAKSADGGFLKMPGKASLINEGNHRK
jgi:hypothetical protein